MSSEFEISRFAEATPLLEREDPQATDLTEIRHYIRIYTELVAFKSSLLARAQDLAGRLPDDAQTTVAKRDIELLEEQRDRIHGRLEYWHRRFWELAGVDLDAEALVARYRGRSVELTRREFELLKLMLTRPNDFVRPRQLLVAAWGEQHLSEEQLRTYIVRLRRRLTELDVPITIENNRRQGYRVRFVEAD